MPLRQFLLWWKAKRLFLSSSYNSQKRLRLTSQILLGRLKGLSSGSHIVRMQKDLYILQFGRNVYIFKIYHIRECRIFDSFDSVWQYNSPKVY